VQVKTATAKGKKRVAGAFNVSMAQLQTPQQPDLCYVLVLNRQGAWRDYLVISREDLNRLRAIERIGHVTDGGRRFVLHISFSQDGVRCNKTSLTKYHENWERWPEVKH
jgi:hypothetical protein